MTRLPPHPPHEVTHFPELARIHGGRLLPMDERVALLQAIADLPASMTPDGTDLVIRATHDAQGMELVTLRLQVLGALA